MELVIPGPSLMDAESDADLLLNVVAGDEIERDQAAGAFFRRYGSQLYRFCKRYNSILGGDPGVQDLTIMTFQRAFEHADTFDDSGIVDQEHSRARTFRWLSTMAVNMMRDWLRSVGENHPLPLTSTTNPYRQNEVRFVHTTDETKSRRHVSLPDDVGDPVASQDLIGNDVDSTLTVSPEKKCLQEALATLKEREIEVIWISIDFSIEGKQLRLPPNVLRGLCIRLGTTEANIRAIRKRAFDKIKDFVATNCQASS